MFEHRRVALASLLAALALAVPVSAMTDEQSHDPRNLTWLAPHALAVGGGGLSTDDLAWLASQGFGAVVDVRSEHDDGAANVHAAGMDYLYIPVATAADITEPQLEQFVSWVQDEQAHGKSVYVHCSNGWHRAPTFGIAWLMATDHLSFDAAAKRTTDARDGVLIRAPGPLLAYQARLDHASGLVVTVTPDPLDVPAGATQTLAVRVTADGAPAAGARVHAWTEEDNVDSTLTTDASGIATVSYTAPTDAPLQHFFARASLPGHEDGAANPEVHVESDSAAFSGAPSTSTIVAIAAGGAALLAAGTATWWFVSVKRRTG